MTAVILSSNLTGKKNQSTE